MPPFPGTAFLLWHDAVVSGAWGKLLRITATADTMTAVWMLQTFGKEPPAAGSAESFVGAFFGH